MADLGSITPTVSDTPTGGDLAKGAVKLGVLLLFPLAIFAAGFMIHGIWNNKSNWKTHDKVVTYSDGNGKEYSMELRNDHDENDSQFKKDGYSVKDIVLVTNEEKARRSMQRGTFVSQLLTISAGVQAFLKSQGADPANLLTMFGFFLAAVFGFMGDKLVGSDDGYYLWTTNKNKAAQYTLGSLASSDFMRYIITVFLDMFISAPIQAILGYLSNSITMDLKKSGRKSGILNGYRGFVGGQFSNVLQSLVAVITFLAYTNETRFLWAYPASSMTPNEKLSPAVIKLATSVAGVVYLVSTFANSYNEQPPKWEGLGTTGGYKPSARDYMIDPSLNTDVTKVISAAIGLKNIVSQSTIDAVKSSVETSQDVTLQSYVTKKMDGLTKVLGKPKKAKSLANQFIKGLNGKLIKQEVDYRPGAPLDNGLMSKLRYVLIAIGLLTAGSSGLFEMESRSDNYPVQEIVTDDNGNKSVVTVLKNEDKEATPPKYLKPKTSDETRTSWKTGAVVFAIMLAIGFIGPMIMGNNVQSGVTGKAIGVLLAVVFIGVITGMANNA